VKWPSGIIDLLENLNADQTMHIVENSNALSLRDARTSHITVYPNPTNETVTLQSKKSLSKVSVFNALSQQVLSQYLSQKKYDLNLSHLKTGMYYLHVTDNENRTQIEHIIKH
jgi:hypothetical protein